MSRRERCVLDTNVLISAGLIPGSVPSRALDWVLHEGTLLGSTSTLDEFASRFLGRAKFDRYVSPEGRQVFVDSIVAATARVEVTSRLAVCADPDDDRFAELAVDGRADCLVTGNTRDFPPEVDGIPVLTPAAFLARVER